MIDQLFTGPIELYLLRTLKVRLLKQSWLLPLQHVEANPLKLSRDISDVIIVVDEGKSGGSLADGFVTFRVSPRQIGV